MYKLYPCLYISTSCWIGIMASSCLPLLTGITVLFTISVSCQNQSVAPAGTGKPVASSTSPHHDYDAVGPLGEFGPTTSRTLDCVAQLKQCVLTAKNCCMGLECTAVGDSSQYMICLPVVSNQVQYVAPKTSSLTDPKCPYTSRIEQITEPLRDGPEFTSTLDALQKRKTQSLIATAYRGDRTKNYHVTVRNIHLAMRENYQDMIREIGNNIYPLIVATDVEPGSVSGVGGIFSLYLEDGSMRRISPTSPEFEMLKNLAHLPLGLFTILSPHFLTPRSLPMNRLIGFQSKILEAINAASLGDLRISPALKLQGTTMLNITNSYIVQWLSNGYVTVADFETYTGEMFPYVDVNIKRAASLQVEALLPHLNQWKEDLGEKWKDVYALIPTIWPVSGINPRLQVLSQLMSPEQVKTQVLMLENGGTLQDKRATLGRIVGDRAAAFLILNTKTESQRRLTFALSTKQDLLANSCADAITEYFKTNPRFTTK